MRWNGCFDLAPPGAFWYQYFLDSKSRMSVLISLPPEHSGIGVRGIMRADAGFDLAPPGAFWYPKSPQPLTAHSVLISLPPEHSGIRREEEPPALVPF